MLNLSSKAYHLGQHISIPAVKEMLDFKLSNSESEFLLYEVAEQSWVYIKDFGSAVFINVDQKTEEHVLSIFFEDYDLVKECPFEEFTINVSKEFPVKIEYGVVQVPEISQDVAHIIAIHLAQTVALDDFQKKVEDLLVLTGEISEQLNDNGQVLISRKRIRKLIGSSMILKSKIAEYLYIYDVPNLAWSNETLAKIDEQMRSDLDLNKRHAGIQFHLSIIKENLDLYQNILQHKHSSTLEWIIILLILFEVIQVIF